jgi:hypothetical protein
LEAAKPMQGAEPGTPTKAPKTIRIKPTSDPSTVKVSRPTVMAPAPSAEVAPTDKKKTSRISLEAALSSQQQQAEAEEAPPAAGAPKGGPKTIRLKRPSEISTVKISDEPPLAAAVAEAPTMPAAGLGKTEELESPRIEEEEKPTPTRRKTIRVKRPTQRPGVRAAGTVAARPAEAAQAQAAVAAGAPAAAMAPVAPVTSDEPSWLFPVFTVVAIIVTCVLIYVLCAQALGPNSSLTQLSSYKEGPDLSWPGKIQAGRQP